MVKQKITRPYERMNIFTLLHLMGARSVTGCINVRTNVKKVEPQ